DIAEGLKLAERIPHARFMGLPGDDHLPWIGDIESLTDAVEMFLSDTCPFAAVDHVLAAVLATIPAHDDVCDQTRQEQRDTARREVLCWRGTVLPAERDGILAMFDSPSRAIHCASAIRNATRAPGPGVRTGIHAGEVHLEGERAAGP